MDIYRLFEHRMFVHHLPIVLNWIWKNVVIPSYRFRIIEILLYLFFMVTTTDLDGTYLELYFRLTCIGMVMILINVSYDFNKYHVYGQDTILGMKILFNNHWTRSAGFFICGLLLFPVILYIGISSLILCGAIFILWISIKYIISVFKK